MQQPKQGVLCAGCPHRGAYLAAKNAVRGTRGAVICGDVGCPAVGYAYPAAATCPGGMERLLPRYRKKIPTEPTAPVCVRFTRDTALSANDAAQSFSPAALACEGAAVVLAVLASSAACATHEGIETVGKRLLELGIESVTVADPLDLEQGEEVLRGCFAAGGVTAVVFASPCTLLVKEPLEPAEVDRFACVGCHRCAQITGCPALSLTPPVYHIDPDACAGCDLCVGTCRTQIIYTPRLRMTFEERRALRYRSLH